MLCVCAVDWDALGSILSGLAAWAGVGAVVWAAKQGRDAVSDWRTQKVIERQMDVGERALTAAYRAKSALESIRSNLMTSGELARAQEDLAAIGLLDDQPKKNQRAILVRSFFNRVNATKSDWDEVFAVIPLCIAYFGEEVAEAMRTLIRQRNSVVVAGEGYLDDAEGTDRLFSVALRRQMFRDKGGDDPIASEVDKVISSLEKKVLPLLGNGMLISSDTK